MKKRNRYLLIIFAIVAGCLFFFQGEAEATEVDFYKKYSNIYGSEEHTIKLNAKCRLTISIDCPDIGSDDEDDEDWYDEDAEEWHDEDEDWYDEDEDDWEDVDGVYVLLEDSKDSEVYEKLIEDRPFAQKTITLPAGKYSLYIDSDVPSTITLSGEYIPELSAKRMTLEVGKSGNLKVKGISKRVNFKSSNKSVAAVSKKGVVKAKKEGTATITATCRNKTLRCKVIVKLSYNDLFKKMKAYAKKNKNFNFLKDKTLLSRKTCRLYGKKILEDKVTQEYALITEAQPCIELSKYDGKTELKFRIFVRLWKVSHGNVTLSASKIQLSASNRRLVLKSDSGSSNIDYDYDTGYEIGQRIDEYTISEKNNKSLKKFEDLLVQNSLILKARNYDGTIFQAGVNADTRKNWKKLVREYRTLR